MVIGGIVLLVVAAGMAVWAQVVSRRLKAMARVETMACGDLASLRDAAVQAAGPGTFRLTCEVAGTAEPGDHGLLRAELSKVECVWHRHSITRVYERQRTDSRGNPTSSTEISAVAQFASTTSFRVRDASGAMLVDPAGTGFDRAEKVVERFERLPYGGFTVSAFGINLTGGDNTLGYQYEEWVVRAGQRLFLLGEAADRDGQLVMGKPSSGLCIFSTRSEQELARGFRTERKLARIGAAVTGVAGLILLVAGLLS